MYEDDDRIGSSLGGFVLQERIGSGATGVVYGTERDGIKFAVKVLSRDLANAETLTKRFEREARVLRKLEHPGIVRIESFGIEGEDAYIVMERLTGETLEDRLQRDPISSEETLTIMKKVLAALTHAHQKGIAHRDLKPANVFLVDKDTEELGDVDVRVLDFGLAKFLSHDEANAEGTLTRKGRVVGTPAYMAPEQITGVAVDERVDVYAAGVILYEMIADQRPFTQVKRSDLLRAHLFDDVPDFESVNAALAVDGELEQVVRRALSKDPARRFQTAAAFRDALQAFAHDAVGPRTSRTGSRLVRGTSSVVIAPKERDEAETNSPPSSPWHEAGWVTALVWVVGLACFGAVVSTMVYAGVVLR